MSGESPDRLNIPPFPQMEWSDCDWWDGVIDIDFGQGAALTVTPYDPSVSRLPSDAQAKAMKYQMENGDKVITAVLNSLRPYYADLRPKYLKFLGSEADALMPKIQSLNQLRGLIDLRHVHVHPWKKDEISYVGLQFGCTWDQEHGLGVMLHQSRVVDIGGADVSFAWSPAEADQ
jgi:hypothetical protein